MEYAVSATHSANSKANSTTELRRALVTLRPDILARALRMSRSQVVAEDLVQDTIERAMKFESHYITGTNVRAWVLQILFSVFITRCRRQRRERNAISWLTSDPNAWTTPAAPPPIQHLSPAIVRALDALPASFRRAVELVNLSEMAYRDAADVMGVPVGTVMSRLHRGRKLLAAALREQNDSDSTRGSSAAPTIEPSDEESAAIAEMVAPRAMHHKSQTIGLAAAA